MRKIIEWGHFYASEGFSTESKQGWEIADQMSQKNGNESMVFIDDIHEKSFSEDLIIIPVHIDTSYLQWNISDKAHHIIEETNKNPQVTIDQVATTIIPNHILLESEMTKYTEQAIELLRNLPRRKKVRFRDGKWAFCSNIKIIHPDSTPTCVWYDLWLTLFKQQSWFDEVINVLPSSYEEQQASLKRIYKKIDPNFPITQIYYNNK